MPAAALSMDEFLRPLLILAVVSFLIGFAGFLAFGQARAAAAYSGPQSAAIPGSAADAWNRPKNI